VETEIVLTDEERTQNYVLSCNAKPLSNLKLDIEDVGSVTIFSKKIVPAKVDSIEKITNDVIKIVFRLPPTANFDFNAGQYVNLIKGNLNRSYSIASKSNNNNQLEFFIKKYEQGLMSQYWFDEAKVNDLLRLEGPLGTFFLRDSVCHDIVFLATGTGVAPIKSILETMLESANKFADKKLWVIVGARYEEDLFWDPKEFKSQLNINFIPVLSRASSEWEGERGYVQDVVLKQTIDLKRTQVYACGSNTMIEAAKKLLIKNSLKENQFFSDAFVATN
jgi:CDP-4-dehydro-6-deoxyglucose reductase